MSSPEERRYRVVPFLGTRAAGAAARQKVQASCGTQSPVARYWTFLAIETAWSANRSW